MTEYNQRELRSITKHALHRLAAGMGPGDSTS
jgi:hypothetical protein